MIPNLAATEFLDLLRTVFRLRPTERALAFLVDLPVSLVPDTPEWADRRALAAEWSLYAADALGGLPFTSVILATYPTVGMNNGDLPPDFRLDFVKDKTGWLHTGTVTLGELLRGSSVVLAPTEFSATAPLKVLAREYGFRGATLPGFNRSMIPALGLDYGRVHERVTLLKERMDRATGATVDWTALNRNYHLFLDLRFNTAHVSGGLMREDGIVGNLPSGEAYIVPFEGAEGGEGSKSEGLMPVQFGNEVVVFEIEKNRAVRVASDGPQADAQRALLDRDPAYGNLAELGVGVLSEWGVQATGSPLLDEKLGLHIAFGRSDHFGGRTSPKSFRDPRNVIHVDWVYVPSSQPLITAPSLVFHYPDGSPEQIVSRGKILV